MAGSLEEIRAKLKELEAKSKPSGGGDKQVYPFWNIGEGETTVLRFLPDKDPENTFFWVERQMIRLKFPGVKGGEESKPVTVQVPCMEMYNESCPVLTEIRPWFKDPSLEDQARSFWKKRSYIFQGLVNDDTNPLNEEGVESQVRRFVIGPQIFNIIKSALMDPDMDNIPTDFGNGTDFRLTKTTKGQYADYSTSKWSRKERALDEDELSLVQEHGLYNLNDFIPAKPSADGVQAIKEMFEASVDGDLYDPARWATYYKPYGVDAPSTAPATAAPAATAASETEVVTEAAVEKETAVVTDSSASKSKSKSKSTDDILAMLRDRKQDS